MGKQQGSSQGLSESTKSIDFGIVHRHAAGIDLGSKSHFVAIGQDDASIREFGVFTEDHHEMAKWLKSQGVQTIAMESTGFYWKSLFLLLQSYDFEVLLVNAHHIKTIGKKTDVKDARWIWRLHTAGLLQGSYQPDEFTGQLRTYNRQRQSLIRQTSRCSNVMKKSLILMNLHLSVVLSDIMGKSGQAIIQSIINGERDSKKLASLANRRVKKSKATIAKALTGTWHEEHLFTLKQSWDAYQFYRQQIQSCDEMIEQLLEEKVQATGQNDLDFQPKKKSDQQKTRLM